MIPVISGKSSHFINPGFEFLRFFRIQVEDAAAVGTLKGAVVVENG